MGRKLALFADGTGNAFTTQESNIWRLYQALDQSQPDQIARYIPGVGTSGFRPLAMLDGATGIGVPSNVRKLYRFLCWNWQPGDEVYLFGFSRGAFTIRTLVGLINSEGLVPAAIDGDFVSRADMERNAMGAWRAYREKTAGGIVVGVSPLVWLTRKSRNTLLWAYDRIRRHRPYDEVRRETERQNRLWRPGDDSGLSITFLGLFDTVEAYGVPIEELRSAIDWAIWPISFRNNRLSGIVRRACHALALDDERISFHPLRFDMTLETGEEGSQRISEVWFAGVHSDVGGGYPESALAHVPLHWIASAAGHAAGDPAGQGLRFTRGEFEGFAANASPLEPMHDSRAGAAVFYRYGPRPIRDDVASGGAPVIHHSVAEKMVFGSEGYAPITLPPTAYVLLPDGVKRAIKGFGGRERVAAAALDGAGRIGGLPAAEQAVARLSEPSQAFVELTRDTVWWRRIAYMALLAAFICTAALPVTAGWLTSAAKWAVVGLCGESCWQSLADANTGASGNLDSIAKVIGGFLPDYAAAWIAALIRYPFTCLAVVGGTYLLYRTNNRLRDRIADRARCAWFSPLPAGERPSPNATPGPWLKLARFFRQSPKAFAAYSVVTRYLVPGLLVIALLLAVLLGVLLSIDRITITYRETRGTLCATEEAKAGERIEARRCAG